MSRMPGVCHGISLNAVFVIAFLWCNYRVDGILLPIRIDGGTGMVLAQKKFPTCVYIVHTLDNLHYSQQKSILAVNTTTHKALLSRVLGLFANLAIHRDWLDDKYFVWGGGGGGRARAVNDVGWEPIGHQEVGNHRKQYFPRAGHHDWLYLGAGLSSLRWWVRCDRGRQSP